jgi:branched-chain amino acid transport system ATP-binding protein
MLELAGLHAFYGKSHVLRGVDLHVGEGEIVSLLGRNGAGRSTTVKAVMGLVEGRGSVRWRGRSCSAGRPSRSRAWVSATCPRAATSSRA